MSRLPSGSLGRWAGPGSLPAVLGALLVGLVLLVPVGTATAASPIPQIAPHVYQGGGVIGFGDAQSINAPIGPALSSVMVAMALDPAASSGQQGYWLAAADGGVFAQGSAGFYGSLGALHLNGPIVGMAATPTGRGYWLVAMDGGVFSFGDATFYGSMGGSHLNRPVVGMAATPSGKGYWLVAADGGVFSFGDAAFHGSEGSVHLNAPITGMASTSTGNGYWLVAADGGIFTFGDAPFYGSMGGAALNDPVVEMVATPHDLGYLMVSTDGEVFHFGLAGFYGSLAGGYGGDPAKVPPIAGMALTPDGQGYWLLEPDGWSYSFTNPPSAGAVRHFLGRRVHRQQPGGERSRPRLVLQSLRPVRGVVCPVRHLGVGAGRRAHPGVPLHRQHLRLGRGPHRRAPTERRPAPR